MRCLLPCLMWIVLPAMGAEVHWSLVPPKKAARPPVEVKDWPLRELDHFVLAKMEQQKLMLFSGYANLKS